MEITQTDTDKATPRPWAISHNVGFGDITIADADGIPVAELVDDSVECRRDPSRQARLDNAASLIVRAVNSHEALVKALRGLVNNADPIDTDGAHGEATCLAVDSLWIDRAAEVLRRLDR